MTDKNSNGTTIALSGNVRLEGMADVFALSKALARANGFVPRHLVDKPDAIAAVILTGVELGIGPMEAMRGIHVVEGKPTMSAEMMLARARKAGVRTRWLETSDKAARLAVTVQGDTEPQVMEFTWADATRIGCTGKDNWKKYPAAMLRARCISSAMRAFCPEVLGAGVYEADSGELTDGRPSAEVMVTQPARPALPASSEPIEVAPEEMSAATLDVVRAFDGAQTREEHEAARSMAATVYDAASRAEQQSITAASKRALTRIKAAEKAADEAMTADAMARG